MLSRRSSLLAGFGVVLVVTGVTVACSAPSSHKTPSLPVAASSVPPAAKQSAAPTPAAIARVVPTRVIIPAIGVNAAIEPVGLCPSTNPNEDCTGVPTDGLATPLLNAANLTGWWNGGAAPGQAGPAVIVGHVNSAAAGNLVFANLYKMAVGETIEIEPGNLMFKVTATQEIGKNSFPTQAVYGSTLGPELRLITCGGGFNKSTGHYTDNFIVYAKEVVK